MDLEKIRQDFPMLQQRINGKPIIYFDNACTTLKTKQLMEAMNAYYSKYTGCAGRSVHKFAIRTTEEYEKAREKVAKFLNARKPKEIIWTKNTTEAINLVAHSFKFEKGDKVVTTNLEHSSGLIPWQELARKGVIDLHFVLCNKEGEFNIEDFKKKIDKKTKLVSIIFASNVTATKVPLEEIIKIAHDHGATVLADGAQSVPHIPINVKKLDVDFLAFSAHKMCGPTGLGCLYGKEDMLRRLEPFILGGETIKDAELTSHVLEDIPYRFEAGIQNYAGVIGFGATIDYLTDIGMENIEKYEKELSRILIEGLLKIPNLSLIGPKDWKKRGALAAFNIEGIEPQDLALMLNEDNIAIRSGAHCTYPFHKFINRKKGSDRASLYFYNTREEIRIFLDKLGSIAKTLGE